MTRAEKYKEVFGLEPDDNSCPTLECSNCPCYDSNMNLCGLTTKAWWHEELEDNYRANSKGLLTVNCNDCDGYEAGYSAGLKDAERPQGEWIHNGLFDYRCSICNSYPLERGDYPELSKYCPHCGAHMRGDNND